MAPVKAAAGKAVEEEQVRVWRVRRSRGDMHVAVGAACGERVCVIEGGEGYMCHIVWGCSRVRRREEQRKLG